MKKSLIVLALLSITKICTAQHGSALTNPESVISDKHFLYVTNMGPGSDPAARHGKGYITKTTLDGKVLIRHFNKQTLNNPKGTGIIGNTLYVADLNSIVGISLHTGKTIKTVDLSKYGTALTNDITVKDDHTLFVSATDIGKVFSVDLNNDSVKLIADVPGANGLCYDAVHDRLYVCGIVISDFNGGHIYEIDLAGNRTTRRQVGTFGGAFDGLALLDDHTLIVSDWKNFGVAAGVLLKIDLRDLKETQLPIAPLYGPADFLVDVYLDKIVIPVVKDNKIEIYSLSSLIKPKIEKTGEMNNGIL